MLLDFQTHLSPKLLVEFFSVKVSIHSLLPLKHHSILLFWVSFLPSGTWSSQPVKKWTYVWFLKPTYYGQPSFLSFRSQLADDRMNLVKVRDHFGWLLMTTGICAWVLRPCGLESHLSQSFCLIFLVFLLRYIFFGRTISSNQDILSVLSIFFQLTLF